MNFILSYWNRRGIPTPSSFKWTRLLLPIHLHDQLVYQTYGRVVGLYEGFRPTLLIGDPELVRDILGKDFHNFPNRRAFNFGHLPDRMGLLFLKGSEEKWVKIRSLIRPHFSTSFHMRSRTAKINECIADLLNNLSNVDVRQPVDMMRFYNAFSLDLVASTAFGIRVDSLREPDNPIVSNAKLFFGQKPISRILFEFYLTLSRIKQIRPSDFESFNYFTRLTERITREKRYQQKRKKSNGMLTGKKADFIQMFLNLIDNRDEGIQESIEEEQQEEDNDQSLRDPLDLISIYGHDFKDEEAESQLRGKTISFDEVKAQGILFFMAGFAGTASLLANISFLLAKHPKEQERLIQEIDAYSTQEFNFDIVQNCKYLDAVVWESLRLYPPVARVERECTTDYKLGKSGITVPAGMTVSIPIYAIHRDPLNFEDPENFVPERFLSCGDGESAGLRHPWCFLPFGGGPRNCLGIRQAVLEAKLCIAHFLKRYRFHADPGLELEHVSDQVLVSPKKVPLRLEKRKVAGRSMLRLLRKTTSSQIRISETRRKLKRQATF